MKTCPGAEEISNSTNILDNDIYNGAERGRNEEEHDFQWLWR